MLQVRGKHKWTYFFGIICRVWSCLEAGIIADVVLEMILMDKNMGEISIMVIKIWVSNSEWELQVSEKQKKSQQRPKLDKVYCLHGQNRHTIFGFMITIKYKEISKECFLQVKLWIDGFGWMKMFFNLNNSSFNVINLAEEILRFIQDFRRLSLRTWFFKTWWGVIFENYHTSKFYI